MAELTRRAYDPNSVLSVLISFTENVCQNSSSFTTHQYEKSKCKFVYPFCTDDSHLSLRPFYGETDVASLEPWKKVAVIEDSLPSVPPDDRELIANIKSHVDECLSAVPSQDREVSTAKLFMGKMYFHVNHEPWKQDVNNVILKNGATLNGQFKLARVVGIPNFSYVKPVKNFYSLTSSDDFVQFLRGLGAQIVSKENLPETVALLHTQIAHTVNVSGTKFYVNNNVFLDPKSLKFDSWRFQRCYPMSLYLLSNIPDFNDIFLEMNTQRSANLEDIVPEGPRPRVLTEPGLDGWLKRTEAGYKGSAPDWRVKVLLHTFKSEVIRMCFNDVNFIVNVENTRLYSFDQETFEFCHCVTNENSVYLKFELNQNRQRLIDVITHFSVLLLGLSTKSSDLVHLCPVPQYINEPGGRRLSCEDARAILRLRFESGSLSAVLGLESDASRSQRSAKALEVMDILRNCRHNYFLERTKLDYWELVAKLRHIANEEGIDV